MHIGKGAVVRDPLFLLFVSTAHGAPVVTHPRNLIVVGAKAARPPSSKTMCRSVAAQAFSQHGDRTGRRRRQRRLALHDRARRHRSLQRLHACASSRGGTRNVSSHSVLIGGALVRNNVHPVLAGEGGECLINGLFIGTGQQHLDNYMLVEHASPHCGSRQFYNGILDGSAHGVFHGRIIVHKDAQKTDAKQTNRNLLLSDNAQIDTKPQLEIYADDVKCTHGATIGQIEENALFYLRSRGIDELSARRLLLVAFASECLDRMKQGPARTHAERLINEHLFHLAESSPALARESQGAGRGRDLEEVG